MIDSVKVICSKEVGGISEESIVTNSNKYAKEFQNVFNSISVMEFDPKYGDRFCESDGFVP